MSPVAFLPLPLPWRSVQRTRSVTKSPKLLETRSRRKETRVRCTVGESASSASNIGRELVGRNQTWTQQQYEKWISMRIGTDPDKPVYWYAIGDVFAAPRGSRELVIEMVDVAKTTRLSSTVARQLSRKLILFRDVETNEVVTEYAGKEILPLRYEYQAITYSLENGSLVAETTYGKGDSVVTLRGDRFYWRNLGQDFVICSPLFTERGWIENYDFYGGRSGYRVSWHGIGPSSLLQGGQVVMEMSGLRLERFEDVPESLRSYILENAPMWRLPPQDMDEVKRLQAI